MLSIILFSVFALVMYQIQYKIQKYKKYFIISPFKLNVYLLALADFDIWFVMFRAWCLGVTTPSWSPPMTRTGESGMTGRSVLTTPSLMGNTHTQMTISWWYWHYLLYPDDRFAQKTDAWCSGGGECTGLLWQRIFISGDILTQSLVRPQWSWDDVRETGGGNLWAHYQVINI